jgi:CRP-like cAMP-binding protein
MVDIARLKSIPIFHSLNDTDIRLLAGICDIRTFKKGEALFRAGDHRTTFFVQLSGQIHIFRLFQDEPQTLALLDDNEFAVETALVEPKRKHEHYGEMMEEGELLTIQANDFTEFRKKHADIANAVYRDIIENLTSRLHHANNKLVTLFYTGRIAATYDDLDHLTDLLLDTILHIIRARRAAFILFKPLEGKAVIQDAKGYHSNQEVRNCVISLTDDPILGPLYHSGRDVIITEEQFKQERALHTSYASPTMLATPLKVKEKVIGAILLGDKVGKGGFSHNNQVLLNIIARQVAFPIAHAIQEVHAK